MASERAQLEWLSIQNEPRWGGHLERGEPMTDDDLHRWIDNGWVEVWPNHHRRGYRLTDLGRSVLPILK